MKRSTVKGGGAGDERAKAISNNAAAKMILRDTNDKYTKRGYGRSTTGEMKDDGLDVTMKSACKILVALSTAFILLIGIAAGYHDLPHERGLRAGAKRVKIEKVVKNPEKKKKNKLNNIAGEITNAYSSSDIENKISRGEVGLTMDRTPALIGAKPAQIQCNGKGDTSIDGSIKQLAYWNDPQGKRDIEFSKTPPFQYKMATKKQYLAFVPDPGGWNNIRMSLESIFVYAAATGRTVVLPPDQPLYLLKADKKKKQRGFGDFYNFKHPQLNKVVKIITTEEFLKREGGKNGQFPIPDELKDNVLKVQNHCERRAKSGITCNFLWSYYEQLQNSVIPKIASGPNCVIFGPETVEEMHKSQYAENMKEFCGSRKPVFYDNNLQQTDLLFFKTDERELRLMEHFYNLILFEDPVIDHFYKRFVRDFLHYHDEIFCAAARVIDLLHAEGTALGFKVDQYGAGGYSAYHIRRGDLQFKKVKISAEEWVANTQHLWKKDELIYIATDERNQTYFEPFKQSGHTIRFLDDYFDSAQLHDIDPNYFGMIDTIVASRGRAFVGTYFSTFSGFINRMRGYHGMSMKNSKYGYKPNYDAMMSWERMAITLWHREYPAAWVGIDGDELATSETFAF